MGLMLGKMKWSLLLRRRIFGCTFLYVFLVRLCGSGIDGVLQSVQDEQLYRLTKVIYQENLKSESSKRGS